MNTCTHTPGAPVHKHTQVQEAFKLKKKIQETELVMCILDPVGRKWTVQVQWIAWTHIPRQQCK